MYILGISAFYHDSAAALIQDAHIIAAAQEERFTRKKHDDSFPKHAVNFCLQFAGITIEEVDYVAFYEKPFIKFERILETYLATAPIGITSFLTALPIWLSQKLWIKEVIAHQLNYKGPQLYPQHHLSHAASAFYPSPFSEASFLTIDGVGEWTTTSWGIGKNNKVSILSELTFPHSLGLLYSAFTYYTGFKVNSGEYKVMGLAPYGRPIYAKKILDNLIDVKNDGSFHLNMDYFNYVKGLTMTNEKFHNLFGGPPRKSESELTQKEMDVAASIQLVTEEVMLKIARHIKKETKQKNLVLAGGVALNCIANTKILRAGIFEDIWIQPAAGDAGGAVGAALASWYHYLDNPRKVKRNADSQKGSYFGPEFTNSEIEKFLKSNKLPHKKISQVQLSKTVATLLGQEQVIGWFQGRMEFGPRALGNRSILGDARSPKMQETMNVKIKFRESFRPFAPAVLSEKIKNDFDDGHISPYMLLIAYIKKQKRKKITRKQQKLFGLEKLYIKRSHVPAITHIDYSARVQTVHKDTNPLFHNLLTEFNKKYKTPVLINTSFNVRGEPIVCTPEDAYRCFMRTDMDYLVLGNFILDKKKQPIFNEKKDWRSEFQLD